MVALFVATHWKVAPAEGQYQIGNGVFCSSDESTPPRFAEHMQNSGCGYFRRTDYRTAVQMPNLLIKAGLDEGKEKHDIAPFCAIFQEPWQIELYREHHRNGIFLDATHNTNK